MGIPLYPSALYMISRLTTWCVIYFVDVSQKYPPFTREKFTILILTSTQYIPLCLNRGHSQVTLCSFHFINILFNTAIVLHIVIYLVHFQLSKMYVDQQSSGFSTHLSFRF